MCIKLKPICDIFVKKWPKEGVELDMKLETRYT